MVIVSIMLLAGGLVGVATLIVGLQVLLSPRSLRQQKRKKYDIGLLYSGYGIVAGDYLSLLSSLVAFNPVFIIISPFK